MATDSAETTGTSERTTAERPTMDNQENIKISGQMTVFDMENGVYT